MIDKAIFQTSRDVARMRLPEAEARNSFGYYIDIPNNWESYRSPEELIGWFGIHVTHIAQFPELTQNLGALTPEEISWARRYTAFFDIASQMLATTGVRCDLRYDIAETLTDWRRILKFKQLPARILDFGAGCARQGVSAFLRDPGNVYVAVDGTLAAYTLQNFVFALIDTATGGRGSFDLLDFEAAQAQPPRIGEARPGSRFHVPVWLIEDQVPSRFFDVVLASHVLFELSGYDFMRLIHCIDRGLADDGIVYVRGELNAVDPRDFFDAIDLHSYEIVPLLRQRGIVPIHCEHDTYLTTVFAREGSAPHRAARARGERDLTAAQSGRDLVLDAGRSFVLAKLQQFAADGWRAVAIGDEGETFFEELVRPALPKLAAAQVLSAAAMTAGDADQRRKIREFDADVVIICSHDGVRIQALVQDMLGREQFPLQLHYSYPIFFLIRDRRVRREAIFDQPIRTAADIPGARPPRLHEIFPEAADPASAR